jgi:hypothetical protein
VRWSPAKRHPSFTWLIAWASCWRKMALIAENWRWALGDKRLVMGGSGEKVVGVWRKENIQRIRMGK